MNIIAIFNPRGGCGKTTVSLNLCAGLARLGKKTLLLDLDPKSDLTSVIGRNLPKKHNSVFEFLRGRISFEEIICKHKNFNFIPSKITLYNYNAFAYKYVKACKIFRRKLNSLKDYDYVLIDCAPSLGNLNWTVMNIATEIISPFTMDFCTEEEVRNLFHIISHIDNKWFKTHKLVCNRYDSNDMRNKKIYEAMKKAHNLKILSTVIRDNENLADSLMEGGSIFEYSPTSSASHDYLELSLEVIGTLK